MGRLGLGLELGSGLHVVGRLGSGCPSRGGGYLRGIFGTGVVSGGSCHQGVFSSPGWCEIGLRHVKRPWSKADAGDNTLQLAPDAAGVITETITISITQILTPNANLTLPYKLS